MVEYVPDLSACLDAPIPSADFARPFQCAVSLSGAVWIDRKRSKNALQVMAKAGDDMKRKGVSLVPHHLFLLPHRELTLSSARVCIL